ncbi:MAG: hypothetical protein HDQ93_06830 [Desulfovibrio sp.]|nr:hypothetical protein [Desulfovibrio sp.]
MTKNHPILIGPLAIAALAVAFCVWTAFGNDVNICVTTGCSLYQDFSVFGVSMWWIGCGAFLVLCACALFGQAALGKILAAIFLWGDACLLILMATTSPCVSCLVAALFFGLSYYAFRIAFYSSPLRPKPAFPWGDALLKRVWFVFFVINLGLVLRSQLNVWPILDEGDARARMFFSLSCPRCLESVSALSGRIDIAYYPIAENDEDLFRIAAMKRLIDEGANVSEALAQTRDVAPGSYLSSFAPEALLLRFRLLRNKAYVLQSGSQGVPFFEYYGVPPDVLERIKDARKPARKEQTPEVGKSDALPPEILDSGQCVGNQPCPPAEAF